MKLKLILWFAVTSILAAGAGWVAGNRATGARDSALASGERRVQFYQDSMHPWIKSDKPGKCTICGMDLTPVHEGEAGLEGGEGLITLSASNVNVADVRTAPVRRQNLARTLRLSGTISAADERRVFVSARAEGQVEKLFYENLLGHVKENTPLAFQSSKGITELQREFISLERGDPLEKLPGGEQDRERLRNAARARLAEFGFSDVEIKALPSRSELDTGMEVRTPIAGTVVSRQVFEGMAVKEGQRMFEVVDFSVVWFKFDCYEGDMAWIAPGLEAEVRTPSAPGRTFQAKVNFLDPSIGHMVRSIKGRADLENPLIMENGRERRLLREREYAEGLIKVEVANVLTVPRTAVLSPGARPVVYVEKGKGAYEARLVTLGRVGDEYVEVSEGVNEGELVVTRGNLLIDSQAQINQSGLESGFPAEVEKEVQLTSVTDEQQSKASEVFGIAVSMASALSRDNLEQFNQQVPAMQSALLPFCHAFANEALIKKLVTKLETSAHFQQAPDLAAARKVFLPFSNTLVDFASAIRQIQAFHYLRIYHCPMVDDAVPGAPKDGFWVQAGEAPLRNPFFGASMLGCGVEVKQRKTVESPDSSGTPKTQAAPKRETLPSSPISPPPSQLERYP